MRPRLFLKGFSPLQDQFLRYCPSAIVLTSRLAPVLIALLSWRLFTAFGARATPRDSNQTPVCLEGQIGKLLDSERFLVALGTVLPKGRE